MICPFCGKENVSSFADTVFHTTGFCCEDCHKDFGVNDGKTLAELENELIYCYFVKKDGEDCKTIEIIKEKEETLLTPTRFHEQKLIAYKKVNIDSLFKTFKKVIFENFFILDWESKEKVDTSKNYYQIILKFENHPMITIQNEKFPPYMNGFDQLFLPFFIEANIW